MLGVGKPVCRTRVISRALARPGRDANPLPARFLQSSLGEKERGGDHEGLWLSRDRNIAICHLDTRLQGGQRRLQTDTPNPLALLCSDFSRLLSERFPLLPPAPQHLSLVPDRTSQATPD